MTTANPEKAATRPARPRIYLWMAAVFVAIAFGGFARTYWIALPMGHFRGPPLTHLHAATFSAWIALFALQSWLVARGRLRQHRAWGMASLALVSAMVFTGMALAIRHANVVEAAGHAEFARAFLIAPQTTALILFVTLFAAAISNVARPDWHKRLMLAANLAILGAALARVVSLIVAGGHSPVPGANLPPPPLLFGLIPVTAVIAYILLIIATAYDWRTRGRPHAAYLVSIGLIVGVQTLSVPFSHSHAGQQLAAALQALGR